ncbi:MAG: hypothetical protein NTW31_10565 [Bacteroidetes bacterium]|nr:hypothetical protein [Bacteroidota bacterium]
METLSPAAPMPDPTKGIHRNFSKNFNVSGFTLGLTAIILSILFVHSRFIEGDGTGWKRIITSDWAGYYAYLPSFLIYGDPRWEKFTAAESKAYGYNDYNPQYLTQTRGQPVNKYFAGEALLLRPFFLIALLFSSITGTEVNGLSFFFQLFTGMGSLFYILAGLYYLRKILGFFKFREITVSFVIIALAFGTNLFYYFMEKPAMSHFFSFFAIILFTWIFIRANDKLSASTSCLLGFLIGIIFLLRPVNIIPLLACPLFLKHQPGSVSQKFSAFLNPLLILSLVLTVSTQMLLWYLQSNQWVIRPYPDEGFNFFHPRIADFLFSYRRGWFIYTPMMLLSMAGIAILPGKKFSNTAGFLLFFGILIYICSSWWCWYYGDGFGQRPLIDFYGIFAIPLASVLQPRSKALKPVIYSLVILFIFINLFQTWQCQKKIISPDNMNRRKYFHVFFRTADEYRDCLGGCEEEQFYQADLSHPLANFHNGFEKQEKGWFGQEPWVNWRGMVGKNPVYLFTGDHEFGPGINVRYDSLRHDPSWLYCVITLMIRDSIPASSNKAMIVVSIENHSASYNGTENWGLVPGA